MKKSALIFTLILILVATLSGCTLFKKKQTQATPKPPINEPENIIALDQRPFVTLTPTQDGKKLDFAINTLPKPADELEYELEYQAGTLLQGFSGIIDLSSKSIPVTEETLLGSCSAGGTCTYHQDIKGGTLILRFRGPENYVLKTQWRYQATTEAAGLFSSKDSRFQYNAGDLFAGINYVITQDSSGYPGKINQSILAGPYAITASGPLPEGKIDITINLPQTSDSAQLLGWDGSNWTTIESSLEGKTLTATADLLPVYLVTQ